MTDIDTKSAPSSSRIGGARASAWRRTGLYDPATEHDACGVGLVAAIDGKPRREVVVAGIEALKARLAPRRRRRRRQDRRRRRHPRPDPAGLLQATMSSAPATRSCRAGSPSAWCSCRAPISPRRSAAACIVETEILRFGYYIYGWRQVPVDITVLGEKANATRPEIEQIMIANSQGGRRRVSSRPTSTSSAGASRRRCCDEHIKDFYICSLSCRSIIYKGMFLAEQLTAFYPDLLDDALRVELRDLSPALFDQHLPDLASGPAVPRARPQRRDQHAAGQPQLDEEPRDRAWRTTVFGAHIEDMKPIIQPGSSDSAALDAVFEVWCAPAAPCRWSRRLLIPDAWADKPTMPKRSIATSTPTATAVMEPWDGPAAICAFGGRWALAGMDRNGLRPLRYTVTGDGLLIVGSETRHGRASTRPRSSRRAASARAR